MIAILSTGGTFEKVYGAGCGVSDFSFPEISAVTEIVHRLGLTDVEVVYDKTNACDSISLTSKQRNLIALWTVHSEQYAWVIVHGTDTIIDTARVITEVMNNHKRQKVVVLTGALQPARMRDSDAEFNLGSAIAAARVCSPGVYIAMGGHVFKWDTCQKIQKQENSSFFESAVHRTVHTLQCESVFSFPFQQCQQSVIL